MLKSVTITNPQGEELVLELARPELSGFAVRSIDGLGPGDANINITESGTTDGGRFASARKSPRNIVFHLDFMWMPYETIEDIRQKSYRYFPLKKQIKIRVITDNRDVYIYGNVESNEPDIFSKDESCTISIMCPDPKFYGTPGRGSEGTEIFRGIEDAFEFPFSAEYKNGIAVDLIEFGIVQSASSKVIVYSGEEETGIIGTFELLGALTSNITLTNLTYGESMILDVTRITTIIDRSLQAGDKIVLSTGYGAKYIRLIDANKQEYNILNSLGRSTNWIQLHPGRNQISLEAGGEESSFYFKMEYSLMYEGV